MTDENFMFVIDRIKNVFVELNRIPEYKSAFRHLLTLVSISSDELESWVQPLVEIATKSTSEPAWQASERALSYHLKSALECTRLLLEHLSNHSMDDAVESWKQLHSVVQTDSRAVDILRRVKVHMVALFNDPKIVEQDNYLQDVRKVIEDSRDEMFGKYRDIVEKALGETREILGAVQNDFMTHRFTSSWNDVMIDAFFDTNGRLVLKPGGSVYCPNLRLCP